MEQSVTPARRIVGQVQVPGEVHLAEQALVLAALAEGESRIRNAPPQISRLVEIFRQLGARITGDRGELRVEGCGLRGFRPLPEPLDLTGTGEGALWVLALLVGQAFASQVQVGKEEEERCLALIPLLTGMGAAVERRGKGFAISGRPLKGAIHSQGELDPGLKMAVLIAGLGAEGITVLPDSASRRNPWEQLLRQGQVVVARRWEEKEQRHLLFLEGGQRVQAGDFEIPGALCLAYPFVVAALTLKGSELRLQGVALRTGQRTFLDLVRQLGGEIEIEEQENELAALTVHFSKLKATRVAGTRAERLIDQVALLAVLATQTQGEFVIRDIARLRQGERDRLSQLFALLRCLEARVGEFPEGLVIKGGTPLRGARLDVQGDPDLAMAFGVAGLLAEDEVVIEGAEGLEGIYPDFFPLLRALSIPRRRPQARRI